MNELDFGGTDRSGGRRVQAGSATALHKRASAHGATVHVCGTRAKASDYLEDEGSDLDGLHYTPARRQLA